MNSRTDPLRWGILSTANIGHIAVIPALHNADNCRVVAVASRELERATLFAEANGIPSAYGNYEALLEEDSIDAIYNPLPNSMHCEWTVRAARAGKHVLCEKPLAVTSTECEEMTDACGSAGVLGMEAFMYRFHPRIAAAQDLIAAGAIGDLRSMYSAFTFKLTKSNNIRWMPEFGGGSLMDVGCYCVNVSRTFAGMEPETVQAVASWTEKEIDGKMAGLMRFPNGITAQFDSALSMERREFLHVAGTTGHVELANAFLPGTQGVTIEEKHGREPSISHVVQGVDEYQVMVEHFADCVINGNEVRYPLSEAAQNMRVIEALYRSARNDGTPEPVVRS